MAGIAGIIDEIEAAAMGSQHIAAPLIINWTQKISKKLTNEDKTITIGNDYKPFGNIRVFSTEVEQYVQNLEDKAAV